MNDNNKLLGVPLDPHTGTHGPCQVTGCDIEWAIATSATKYDKSKPDRMSLCLCNDHSRMFRRLSDVPKRTLDKYRRVANND